MFHPEHRQFTSPLLCAGAKPGEEDLRASLIESERALQSLLRSLSGLFYRCELRSPWRMSFVSDGVEELTGYCASELQTSDGWASIMRLEDKAAVEAAVDQAVADRSSFEVTYRIQVKDGDVRWVSERGHAVYDEDGNALFLEGIIRDVSGRREADELQKTMLARWRTTLDTIPQMVWTMSPGGGEEFYNAQWEKFTGHRLRGGADLGRLELVHPDDRARAAAIWEHCFHNSDSYEAQYRLKHVSGDYRWVLSRGQLEKDSSGAPIRWYGTCTDIHDQVTAREALQASEALTRSMVEASPDCIALLNADGRMDFLNPAAAKAFPFAEKFLGRQWIDSFPSALRPRVEEALTCARHGGTGHFTGAQAVVGGLRWWDVVIAPVSREGGIVGGILCIARDITHQKTAEERVRWAANHDALTGLPNRTLFQTKVDRALSGAREIGGAITVLMMDLDDFKRTNDALGHDAGDALLVEFARRVRAAVRADDVVARFGGDEFGVILQGVHRKEEIEAAVGAIMDALKEPCHFDGKLFDIKTSIGASTYPRHGRNRSELLKHADIALYVAKGAGRGVLRMFEPRMRAEAQNRTSMLSLAQSAVSQDRIRPFYQPKVDLRTGRLDGFEALLRWQHPSRGVQTPDTIAAAFEDMSLAAEISDRMIDAVVSDLRRWTDLGVSIGHVAINAAAAEFRRGAFAEKLLDRLHQADLPPAAVQVEVTETVFLGRGAEYVQQALKMLAAEGIEIALDDFGTGYASLSHLNHFPVSTIKIDRSFISRLETSEHDGAIVRAVINLGRSLGIKIVAEGVETLRQAEFLKRHRCNFAQGYFYSKAVDATLVPGLAAKYAAGENLR